jgi:hypothetical protein
MPAKSSARPTKRIHGQTKYIIKNSQTLKLLCQNNFRCSTIYPETTIFQSKPKCKHILNSAVLMSSQGKLHKVTSVLTPAEMPYLIVRYYQINNKKLFVLNVTM